MSKESTIARSQKLGSDILAYNRIISEAEVIDKISAISKKDLTDFATKIITSSKPSFAAIGKIKKLANYEKVSKKFN